jgi:hypothetical protein
MEESMKLKAFAVVLFVPLAAYAQQPAVPRVTYFNGVVADAAGKPQTGTVGITFSLYEEQQGGAPLWSETQNVALDGAGRYTVLLGSATAAGLPLDLFASGKARWLGVAPQVAGLSEPPRILLVGVPYALKAADADTLGGLPASAFLSAAAAVPPAGISAPKTDTATDASPDTACSKITSDGTAAANQIALFSSACNIEPSTIVESGGKVGIGTTAPTATLEVKGSTTLLGALRMSAAGTATAAAGANSYPAGFNAAAFNSSTSAATSQLFQWEAQPVGNDTASPSASMNLLYAAGSTTPANTGFSIASNGQVTFAPGQTFPGTGAITGVTAGTGLTGGGPSGNVTLNVNESVVAFQSDLTAGISTSEAYASSNFLPLSGGTMSGTLSAAGYQIGGAPVLSLAGSNNLFVGSYAGAGSNNTGTKNVFLGPDAGLSNTTGSGNTATGGYTLTNNSTGGGNTGVGYFALSSNTTASGNTASGYYALANNTTGADNTATGYDALLNNTTGGSNTANGYYALVDNATGSNNLAAGWGAVYKNTSGGGNTALGVQALINLASGSNNVAIGYDAGTNVAGGSGNILIAYGSGDGLMTTDSNNIDIGSVGVAGDPGVIRIGTAGAQTAAYMAGISGVTPSGSPVPVGINANGQLGTGGFTVGTITGVTPGYGLTGGGTSGNISLAPDSTVLPFLGSGNTFTAGQTIQTGAYANALAVNNTSTVGSVNAISATVNGSGSAVMANNTNSTGWAVLSFGNFIATGTKSAAVALPDNRSVLLYAVESPENWFEDFGSGQLQDGAATIALDPTFMQTVNPAGYHVYVTANGDCEGLYVTEKTAASFEVHELRAGKSSVAFDYRIVARRKGLESLRLGPVSTDPNTAEALRQQISDRSAHSPALVLPKR